MNKREQEEIVKTAWRYELVKAQAWLARRILDEIRASVPDGMESVFDHWLNEEERA